ncbi:hypothetical protein BDR07DRAFT_1466259 [Suillus spraguei]|nr:hypothetical protein BDR07DRAFT_1466259 [Suillus spraguei]
MPRAVLHRAALPSAAVLRESISEESPDSRCLSFKHEHFTLKARHIGPKPSPHDRNWAVGVLDYSVGDGGYIDRMRKDPYIAFLLSLNKHVPDHLPETARWKKEMTKEVVRFDFVLMIPHMHL